MPAEDFAASTPANLSALVEFQNGAIVSRVLTKNKGGNVTLFAFDAGQELSEHTAPFDALVQVLEGEAQVTIGGKAHPVCGGQIILMPANIPHALRATAAFKMLLTMIRE